MPLPGNILGYLERHAAKMEGEGWHMTAKVLEEAHMEIERLRTEIGIMLFALKQAEKLHQVGILAMHDDEINLVHSSRRAAIKLAEQSS
jgi:hypothetical protein